MKKYELHPLVKIFPPMDEEDKAKLTESIKQNGLIEPIVIYEGQILDGRNRYEVCAEEGIEARFSPWENLTPVIRAAGPLQFVMSRNLARRHLTPSQKAAIAADALPFFEAEAAERQKAAGGRSAPNGANRSGDETSQDTGANPEDESQAPGGGKKSAQTKAKGITKGKAAKAAAKTTGASTRSVERAAAVKKKSPAKFAKVKAGKLTLTKAERDEKKEAAKKTELEDALKRITKVAGKDTAEVMQKRKRPEILELAEMSDTDIQKVRGLITNSDWPLKRAKGYKMTALTGKNTINELGVRAIQGGVGKSGAFTHTLKIEGVTLEIVVKKAKEE